MDKHGLAHPELSFAERQILSDWLTEFEQTWSPAKLAQCVPDLPGTESRLRRSALLGMVLIDMRRNWQGGKHVLVEQYVAQFSELATDGGVAEELLQEEFALRRRHGQTPSSKQFALRFPAQADSIRRWAEKAAATPAAPAPEPVAAATIAPSAETPGQHSVPLLLGELSGKFGRYHIERRLGRGGMGTVYLARDTQLERYVALKIPNFSENDGVLMAGRFRQEARAAARLQHTNICSVFDVGQVEGVHYLTMSYVEGEPLSQQLKAHKTLPVKRAVELARRMAAALEYAHKHGVIHRDLKPSNIMIDRRGEPVVMDFGLARREDTHTTRLTINGETLGTLFYMPPEQLRGELDGMGPHSDVYSLGVILFEMLTGRVPFDGAPAEIVGKLLTEDPPPVSDFRPELTGSPLNDVIRRAMEKLAVNRIPSMRAFADALSQPLAHAVKPVVPVAVAPRPPIGAPNDRPPTEPEISPLSWRRASAPERRNFRIVVVAALLLAAAALAAGVYWYVTRPPADKVANSVSRDEAPGADDVGTDDDAEKQGDPDLEKSPSVSSPKPPDTPPPSAGNAKPSNPIVPKPKSAAEIAKTWQSHIDAARKRIQNRDFDGARADLTLALEFAPSDEKRAVALLERANVNFDRCDFAAARADADRSATLDNASRAEAAATLAKIHCATWDYDVALAACQRVPENHARFPLAQAYRVLALAGKQEWTAAQEAIVKSSANWHDLATGLYARAMVMFLHDRWPTEALDLLARALDREPANAAYYVLRGHILSALHRHDDAIKEFDAAAALTSSLEPHVWKLQTYETKFRAPIAKQVNGGVTRLITEYVRFELNPEAIDAVLARRHPETAAEWNEVARLWLLKKNNRKAAEALDNALALQPRCLNTLFARAFLRVVTAKGNFKPALDDYQQILTICPGNAAALFQLGEIALRQKKPDEAMRYYLESERSDPRYVPSINGRGLILRNRKEYIQAVDVCSAGLEIEPHHIGLLFSRAFSRSYALNVDGALDDYTKLLEYEPTYAAARNNRALLYVRKSELDKALADYDIAVALDPTKAGRAIALRNRGRAWALKNEHGRALDDYTESIRLEPTHEVTIRNRAIAFTKLGRSDEAANDRRAADELKAGKSLSQPPQLPPKAAINPPPSPIKYDSTKPRLFPASPIEIPPAPKFSGAEKKAA